MKSAYPGTANDFSGAALRQIILKEHTKNKIPPYCFIKLSAEFTDQAGFGRRRHLLKHFAGFNFDFEDAY